MHQGWGKEPDPSSRIPSPQVLGWGLFLESWSPQFQSSPRPSRPSALFSTATSNKQQSKERQAAQPASRPSPASSFAVSIAPCPHRNVRSGRWLSSRGGQGIRHKLRRRINTHTRSLCSRPSFALPQRTINIHGLCCLHSLKTQTAYSVSRILHRSNQSSFFPIPRISHLTPRSCTTCAPAPVPASGSAPSSCRRTRISPWLVSLPLPGPTTPIRTSDSTIALARRRYKTDSRQV